MSLGTVCFVIAFLVALFALIGLFLPVDLRTLLIWGLFMTLGHLLSGVVLPLPTTTVVERKA